MWSPERPLQSFVYIEDDDHRSTYKIYWKLWSLNCIKRSRFLNDLKFIEFIWSKGLQEKCWKYSGSLALARGTINLNIIEIWIWNLITKSKLKMIFEYNLSEVKGSRKSVENRPGAEALAGGTINIIYFILLYTEARVTGLHWNIKRDSVLYFDISGTFL